MHMEVLIFSLRKRCRLCFFRLAHMLQTVFHYIPSLYLFVCFLHWIMFVFAETVQISLYSLHRRRSAYIAIRTIGQF